MVTPVARRSDGAEMKPYHAIFPILLKTAPKQFKAVGTGFYITRYGLFLTAGHVMDEMTDSTGTQLSTAFVLQWNDSGIYQRRVRMGGRLVSADIAIGQVDNYSDKQPKRPLINMVPTLTTNIPPVGTDLITYAFPENETLDLRTQGTLTNPLRLEASFYQGKILSHVGAHQRPSIPHIHFETSVEIKSGASGGPVFFGGNGSIVGINCRGWDFGNQSHSGNDHLSSVIPVSEALPITVPVQSLQLPENSWDLQQIPEELRGGSVSIRDLARFNHILFDPPLVGTA